MPAGEHFSNSCHLGEVALHFLDLLLCSNWVQLTIFIGI